MESMFAVCNSPSTLTSDLLTSQVYVQSYHQAVARRLKTITDNQLQITDIYSLLDWLHNMYNRYAHVSGLNRLHRTNRRT